MSILYVKAVALQGQEGAPNSDACIIPADLVTLRQSIARKPCAEKAERPHGVCILECAESQLWRCLQPQLTLGLSTYKLLAPATCAAQHPTNANTTLLLATRMGRAQLQAQAGARNAAKRVQHPPVTLQKLLHEAAKALS